MSSGATTMPAEGQPTLRTRIAAVVIVIALAGLAAYAVFSPPTTVKVGGTTPAKSAPAAQPAPVTGGEPEGEGGGNGD